MEEKIAKLLRRCQEVENEVSAPEALSDPKLYKKLSQEYSYLLDVKQAFEKKESLEKEIRDSKELLREEKEEEMLSFLQEEISLREEELKKVSQELEILLVPPDPRDNCNVILELRAGTGGEEASLFVADCARMYKNYAAKNKWEVEPLSATESGQGGYKEYIFAVSGKNVFRFMQYEAGTHRVQRVPETESQGRVHTSAITVAVLPEASEEEKVDIKEADLRIETYRASGAGGQHVNTTDSAVRIIHIPTNTVVTCQQERSQHKNREKAMRLLQVKIVEAEREKQEKEVSALRSSQVGTGDRSGRIRTYNFPQNRVTDHRIHLTLYNLDKVLEGDLSEITQTLVSFFHQQKLSS